MNIFSSLVRFLTNAADLPFCLKGNLELPLSCGLKMFFGICFFLISFERKRQVLVIIRLPPKTWQIIIDCYWFWMNRKILIAFSQKNMLLIMLHSFVIPYKKRYDLQICSWILMVYVQFWFPLPHELLWSVTLINSRAPFLQCLCISGKRSTGLFAETWLVLVLFCHLDFLPWISQNSPFSQSQRFFMFLYMHIGVFTHVNAHRYVYLYAYEISLLRTPGANFYH